MSETTREAPATVTASKARRHSDVIVLRRVPYQVYVQLVEAEENYHLKMAYHDGTLEIVSPTLHEHERPSRRLASIVTTVASQQGLAFEGSGGATFRRGGVGI